MKKPFKPDVLPIKLSNPDTIELLKLEAEARARVGKFNSILETSVIKKELLKLFALKESVASTKIEGTQASFNEVMESEVTGEKNKDIIEVLNYVEALTEAENLLNRIPISTRMFFKLHETLLRDSSGDIPPEPNLVEDYMSNLEKYINEEYEDDFGYISRAAIIHGQFETIHPFLDGNGRLGRILIIVYLLDKGIISVPAFFVSEELEKNKYKYYALLNGLRLDKPKWKEWIQFFLESSIKQAEKHIDKLMEIEKLYDNLLLIAKEKSIPDTAILFIFNKPVFTIKKMQEDIGVSYNTARNYVKKLEDSGKIYGDDKKRNRVYSFYDLIDLL